MNNSGIITNEWSVLRKFTNARIGLGRSGVSLPTQELLNFQLAHAKAQDAVYLPLDIDKLSNQLKHSPLLLHSKAKDRTTYLQRPDLGRILDEKSTKKLLQEKMEEKKPYDLAITIVDGLSSLAIHENAVNFIKELKVCLDKDDEDWSLSPLSIVEHGRVAIGDEIGELLNANAVLVLVGERPGLSSPDSLGLYLTWAPRVGLKDANRNCISNIRFKGLSYSEAVNKAVYLLKESRKRKLTGVNLKDRTTQETKQIKTSHNFLIN